MHAAAFLRNKLALLGPLALALAAFVAATGGAVSAVGISLVFTIVGIVVVVLILAALAPTFFDALADLIDNFTIVELGTSNAATIAETIIKVLAILVAVGGAFVLVGFALRTFGVGGRR